MRSHQTREELEATVLAELAQLGLTPNQLDVQVDDPIPWRLLIEVTGRQFSIGWVQRDGFFCEETTGGRRIDFTSHVDQPVFGRQDRLRFEALRLVQYALAHPEFRGFSRPMI